jgi:hypothetical protein
MREQSHQREQRQHKGCRAPDRHIRPLTLGFDAHMRTDIFEGNPQLPTLDELRHDFLGCGLKVVTQQRLGLERAVGIAHEHPADSNGWHAAVIPDSGMRCQIHPAGLAAVPANAGLLLPDRPLSESRRQRGLTGAFFGRSTALPRGRRRRVVQGGVQPQARYHSHRLGQTLAGGQQLVGEALVALPTLLMVALGRRQDGQNELSPYALCPRDGRPQHYTQSVQLTGLDEERPAGTDGVALDAFGGDFGPAPALDMVFEAKHDRRIGRHKGVDQQAQQDTTSRSWRSGLAVEEAVVGLEVRIVAQAHHPQHCGDGAFARYQNGINQQDLGSFPYSFAQQQLELTKELYNRLWQVTHGRVLTGSRIPVNHTLSSLFRLLNG